MGLDRVMRGSAVLVFCTLHHLILAQDEAAEVTTASTEDVIVEETKIIRTKSGALRGRRVSSHDKIHYEFLGVPYAEPPVGSLRFKPPTPVR